MGVVPALGNCDARRLFLHRHGLGGSPTGDGKGDDLLNLIKQIGFVQIDSISTVERAHHMILHARRQRYRPKNLVQLLEKDHSLFEHWTHDASIIPTEYFPHWRLRFERSEKRLRESWGTGRRAGFADQIEPVLQQIREQGPRCSADVGAGEARGTGGWWDWHPSKTALEYLWHCGRISVARRESFRKHYDLTENVIPETALQLKPTSNQTIDWACHAALARLGFATANEVAAFWAKVTLKEARDWCAQALQQNKIVEIDVESVDGTYRRCFAHPDWAQAVTEALQPTSAIRILSPFDPALRDRARAERLFGFDYRIEIFVPAAKRKYGYYVFPVLEGDRLIGRIDMKCDRAKNVLAVSAFWPEQKISLGAGRVSRLVAAINRTRQFAGVETVDYQRDWKRGYLQ